MDSNTRERIENKFKTELLETGWLEEDIEELLQNANIYSKEEMSWPIYSIWHEQGEIETLSKTISCLQVTSLEQMEYFDRVVAQALGRVALNYIKRINAKNLTHPVVSETALTLKEIYDILADEKRTNRQKVSDALQLYSDYPFIH